MKSILSVLTIESEMHLTAILADDGVELNESLFEVDFEGFDDCFTELTIHDKQS